jgi:hypothetical protein
MSAERPERPALLKPSTEQILLKLLNDKTFAIYSGNYLVTLSYFKRKGKKSSERMENYKIDCC